MFLVGEGSCKTHHELAEQDSYEACINAAIGDSKCSKDDFVVSFGKGSRSGQCRCNCDQCDSESTKRGPVLYESSCMLIGTDLGEHGFDAYAATGTP